MLNRVIWVCVFLGLVYWLRTETEKERPKIEAEQACLKNAVGREDTLKCFELMDKHKAEREKGRF